MIIEKKFSTEKWFFRQVKMRDLCAVVVYRQCQCSSRRFGFLRWISHTKITYLAAGAEQLLSGLPKKTQYEVRRAERENVEFVSNVSLSEFIPFFNAFAGAKKLRTRLSSEAFGNLRDQLRITAAVHSGAPLVMHMYMADESASRVRLLYSASVLRNAGEAGRENLVGYANRFLHFRDMAIFSEEGIQIYDVGGYSVGNIDSAKAGINKFKDEFGGALVREGNYMSFPYFFALLFRRFINKLL
jgi:hypothetical protein